jgi:hypothetical protein
MTSEHFLLEPNKQHKNTMMRHTQTNWLRNDYTTHFTCNQNQTKHQNHLLLSSTEMKVKLYGQTD